MKWQKGRERIVKYVLFASFLATHRRLRLTVIVWIAGILSISLASAKGFTLEQEELRGGIFSPDGNLLVVRTEAGVLVFNTGNLLRIQKLSTQGLGVGELAFSPDSRYLAWSEEPSFRGGVRVWDLVTFTQVAYFQLNAFDITALLFVPGGELLAVQEMDYISVGTPNPGTVHFWKVGMWEKHGVWSSPGSISSLAFTHDGRRFVASTARGPVGEWVYEQFVVDVETLKPIVSRQIQEQEYIQHIIAYSPDGRFEVVPVNGGNRALLIRDTQNHNLIANLFDQVTGYLLFHSISTDGKWLATYNLQKQIILWNTQTWEVEHRLKLPDGQTIAKGFVKESYWYADVAPTEELRIWDLIKGELLASSSDSAVDVQPMKLKRFTWGMLKSDTLLTNYPNPAKPGTWIPFALHETTEVEIRIYDVAGNLVRTLQLGTKLPGAYRSKEQAAYWDGKNNLGEPVGSGVYSYEMRTGKNTFLRKAVLLK